MQNAKPPEDILAEQHKQWLDNPVTQHFLSLLEKREAKYINDIQESVLKETNEQIQNALRANISCIKTVIKLCSNTETFVQQTYKDKEPN